MHTSGKRGPAAAIPPRNSISRNFVRRGKLSAYIYIPGSDSYGIHSWRAVGICAARDTIAERRTAAPVPFGYFIDPFPTCCGESTTHIDIASAYGYRMDNAIIEPAAQSGPSVTVPAGNSICTHSAYGGEVATHVDVTSV